MMTKNKFIITSKLLFGSLSSFYKNYNNYNYYGDLRLIELYVYTCNKNDYYN